MKKLCILLLLSFSIVQLKAQDGVVFKVKYSPDRNYAITAGMNMKIVATLTGDQQIIDKLNSQGITQPINARLSLDLSGNTKTGSLNSDKSIPLTLEYKINNVSLEANGKQFPVPPKVTDNDFKAIGSIREDGHIQIDSAEGKKLNDTTEKKMHQTMDMFQKQIQFPDKPLKPGDTFTQGTPMTIPLKGDEKITINASVTYKLVSIADGKAYFDMVPNFDLNFKIKSAAVSVTGTGSGKMIYSLKDNLPISKDATINVKTKVASEKINVDGTAVVTSKYDCVIN
jgi:hypothetical protein